MKIQLVKETDLLEEIRWKIVIDGVVTKVSIDKITIKGLFDRYKKNIKIGYPKEEIIEEIIT